MRWCNCVYGVGRSIVRIILWGGEYDKYRVMEGGEWGFSVLGEIFGKLDGIILV